MSEERLLKGPNRSVIYPVDPNTLPFYEGKSAPAAFQSSLEVLGSFGLHSPSQVQGALAELLKVCPHAELKHWSYLMNNTLPGLLTLPIHSHTVCQTPFMILSVTMAPNGNFLLPIDQLHMFKDILHHIPPQVILLMVVIPWDPLQAVGSIWSKLDPIVTSEEATRSCDKQCEFLQLSTLTKTWWSTLDKMLPGHRDLFLQLQQQSVFLCVPSLLIEHGWYGDAKSLQLPNAQARRHYFMWSIVLQHIPQFQHCIAWLCLDSSHCILTPSTPTSMTQPVHLDIPWTDRQFISTLILTE
ncbi:MAG: hypothetical protein Sylvanvirus1_52 [Sylvanvirus sp.]|uniref:Uncharacterized protein n=1 Tax=Sylvanvirus sp. TaxID=2487774 RepID=A0A3G5AGW0_9VIRU|nr:MAG: hypothetical protein Sylvanvirus1_52 [Sylvanvirus sp.]